MAVPRVFVSSTCYDLGPIRFDLERMIKELGYEPVLSDFSTVYFAPAKEVSEAAVDDVAHCHMFVLIIGGRFGSEFRDSGKSITNAEYERALSLKIPIFALVLDSVEQDLRTYDANLANEDVDPAKIKYSSVDSPRVFEFIRQVRSAAFNNALQPFHRFSDIELYLKNQWAGLMHGHLTRDLEQIRVADTLQELRAISEKVEALSRLMAEKIDPSGAASLTNVENVRGLADFLIDQGVNDLAVVRGFPDPKDFAEAFSLERITAILDNPEFTADYNRLRTLSDNEFKVLDEMLTRRKSRRRGASLPEEDSSAAAEISLGI